jgi:hypothetical protein
METLYRTTLQANSKPLSLGGKSKNEIRTDSCLDGTRDSGQSTIYWLVGDLQLCADDRFQT